MPVSTTAWMTALLFGTLLGWGVIRSPEDRALGIRTVAALTIVGAATWLLGPAPDSDHALAAVGMTVAGASATIVAWYLGRRQHPT